MNLVVNRGFLIYSSCISILSLYCILYNVVTVGKIETYVPFTIPIGMNCNYFAILVLLAIVYLLQRIHSSLIDQRPNSVWIIGGGVFLVVTLILLTSRTALVTFLIILSGYVFSYVKETRNYLSLIVPILVLIVAYGIFSNSRFGIGRMDRMFSSVRTLDINEIFPRRTECWHAAWEAIKEKPKTGYGISGAQEILTEKYTKYNYSHQIKYKYHAHNQYLQFGLYGGVGLMILLISALILIPVLSPLKMFWSAVSLSFALPFITDSPLTDWRILVVFILVFFASTSTWKWNNNVKLSNA